MDFKYFSIILLVFCSLYSCSPKTEINIWFGKCQSFGKNGNPQRQINILGNIQSDNENIESYFILNGNSTKYPLTLGSDLHRLAQKGDFNVEIERGDLKEGENLIEIYAVNISKVLAKEKVVFYYSSENNWPLPYQIIWNEVENIQDVVEVIDGNWELTKDGIRTKFMYYDRVLAFGDSSWEDYEISTSVIFHDFVNPQKGPPTYNVSHAAIASRWRGHDKDSLQPNRKWFPVGATSEFRLTSKYDSCRWRIFDGENFYKEQNETQFRTIQPDIKYAMKHRVESISDSTTLYSVKFWEFGKEEPANWDLKAIEKNKFRETGSALLIAHNTDVTFGNVYVEPIY